MGIEAPELEALYKGLNDPRRSREERLALLADREARLARSPLDGEALRHGESNNHIHTIYSFSPYTPSAAALRARDAGLCVAGSVDHDSISAAAEMVEACALVGMASVTGCELRVDFTADPRGENYPFAQRKINNPDSPGIVYMTIQGVSTAKRAPLDSFLAPIRAARLKRTRRMTIAASALLEDAGIEGIDLEDDVLPRSKAGEGGGVTERHLLAVVADRLIGHYGRGASLLAGLDRDFRIQPPARLSKLLADPANTLLAFDLLGLLKSGFLDRIFEQPGGEECPPAAKVVDFARSLGAIPAYAYLGDVGESPTGDKKAEKFEDDFLEDLVDAVVETGFQAITYMPPRNTLAQLQRLRRLCEQKGLMQISGVDINSPRQAFGCPELRQSEFAHLGDSTWALVAHEALVSTDPGLGFFADHSPLAALPLEERIKAYAGLGRSMDLRKPREISSLVDSMRKGRLGV